MSSMNEEIRKEIERLEKTLKELKKEADVKPVMTPIVKTPVLFMRRRVAM